MQYPSIGRIVHYYLSLEDAQALGAEEHNRTAPYAAIVTNVHDGNTVDLELFSRPGESRAVHRVVCAYASVAPESGRWRWPPRVTVEPGASPEPERSPECVYRVMSTS